jgi:hypothetical protein
MLSLMNETNLAATPPAPTTSSAPVELLALISSVEPNPAYILDENWDFLAWNRGYAELTLDLSQVAKQHRNFL